MVIVKIQAGLGNQLFQYAAARALSIRFNTDIKVDLSFYADPKNSNAYRLDKFNLPISIALQNECDVLRNASGIPTIVHLFKRLGIKIPPFYKKSHLIENELLSLVSSNKKSLENIYIEGWFFNLAYFQNYRDMLVKEITPKSDLSLQNKRLRDRIMEVNSVAVHIRRGDFLKIPYFTLLPKEYYIQAIDHIKKEIRDPVFFFFSNDIEWVKTTFSDIANCIFVQENSVADTEFSTNGDIADLMLIRSCKHQIIANSSFSWWGAWLNENPLKKVYCPARYFNNIRAQKEYEKNYFIPENWIKIYF